ncbi:hypothetical protein [Acanthopleuribacter pedis]|uniref:Uncharacterized protein n=1 Tax=Acanthopleuribacter pedis TaxID=442870 RepID=A0A8J7QI92_9BACT|nr:hypothetical protein [Acanthopleuribacter pedis]MBO1321176.1 hypothetical protein [Acanthopleuribacter pedis]
MKAGSASVASGKKKVRGKKRLVKRLQQEARAFQLDLTPGKSYDLWQWQPHAVGPGEFWAERVDSLFVAFSHLLEQVGDYPQSYQTWVTVDESDEDDTALYFHTANATGGKFPIRFTDVTWEIAVPDYLKPYLGDAGTFNCGMAGREEAPIYFIYSNYHGVPLI